MKPYPIAITQAVQRNAETVQTINPQLPLQADIVEWHLISLLNTGSALTQCKQGFMQGGNFYPVYGVASLSQHVSMQGTFPVVTPGDYLPAFTVTGGTLADLYYFTALGTAYVYD